MGTDNRPLYATLAALPKIELHRHLEGTLRLATLVDIARQYQLPMPAYDVEGLRPYVQITAQSPHTIEHFLSKFDLLRRFYCSPEVIKRVAREAVEDAAADNIRYMEMRFTPKALAHLMGYPFTDVIHWVAEAVREAQQGRSIRVNLIASINRHESVTEAEHVLSAVLECRDPSVVAFDLAGQEEGLTNEPFYEVFSEAHKQGLNVTVHAGEWAGAKNVYDAIVHMQAARIGHGVRIVEDSVVAKLAREHNSIFEVCLTSNEQSGVIDRVNHHPLRDMRALGLRTTINTDDPAVSDITLTHELYVAMTALGLSLDEVKQQILDAAASAFLPPIERDSLIAELKASLYSTVK
ncbi:MAG: adenosine deaminase [Anaerolineae bacterium]|nr:adenosine deaminase [Anaerolineae bacterium]